jgi:hypothetical protein
MGDAQIAVEDRIVGRNFGGTFVSYTLATLQSEGFYLGRQRYDENFITQIALGQVDDAAVIAKKLASLHENFVRQTGLTVHGAGGGNARYTLPDGSSYRFFSGGGSNQWSLLEEDGSRELPNFNPRSKETTKLHFEEVGLIDAECTFFEDVYGTLFYERARLVHAGIVYTGCDLGFRHGGLAVRFAAEGQTQKNWKKEDVPACGAGIPRAYVDDAFAFMKKHSAGVYSLGQPSSLDDWLTSLPDGKRKKNRTKWVQEYRDLSEAENLGGPIPKDADIIRNQYRGACKEYAFALTACGFIEEGVGVALTTDNAYAASVVLRLCGQQKRADAAYAQWENAVRGDTQ